MNPTERQREPHLAAYLRSNERITEVPLGERRRRHNETQRAERQKLGADGTTVIVRERAGGRVVETDTVVYFAPDGRSEVVDVDEVRKQP